MEEETCVVRSVRTAEASLRETDSEETRRVLQSHCSAQRTLGQSGEGDKELGRGKAEQQKLARCTSSSAVDTQGIPKSGRTI